MKKNYITRKKLFTSVLCGIIFQLGLSAQTNATINVSEDTYVALNSSGTNYGSDVEGRIRDTVTSAARFTYFKFPVSGPLPATVTSATLKFHTYLPSSDPTVYEIVQIHKLTNNWSEGVVTYNTKPDTGSFISELRVESVLSATPNDYSNSYTVDVTDYFNSVLGAGSTDISIALKAKNTSDNSGTLGVGQDRLVRIGTKEAGTGGQYGATIEIVYTTLGVDDFNSNNISPLKVYPNPVKSVFTLDKRFNSSDSIEISVFNLLGKEVSSFSEKVYRGVWKKTYDKNELNLKSGIYFIRVSSDEHGVSSSKIVIQ